MLFYCDYSPLFMLARPTRTHLFAIWMLFAFWTANNAKADGPWLTNFDANPLEFVAAFKFEADEELIKERLPQVVNIVAPIYNPSVKSYLNIYLNPTNDRTSRMLGWASIYFPLFEKALEEEGLPSDLKYLAIVESALNPTAISRSGAGGLWQFMKPTAKEYGLKITSYIDERMDPEKSTRAAARFLKRLYATFGNWELALAAYNAGPGRVRSAVARAGGSTDFYKVSKYLPAETRAYVPGFIAATYLMHFHEEHDILPIYPEEVMGELVPVMIYKGMSFTELSKKCGLSVELTRRLNPAFVKNYIPTSSQGYMIFLPAKAAEMYNSGREFVPPLELDPDDSAIVATEIDGAMYREVTRTKVHFVNKGENLSMLAEKNKCSVNDIMKWNHLKSTHLAIGQRLEFKSTVFEPVTEMDIISIAPIRNFILVSEIETLEPKLKTEVTTCTFNCEAKPDVVSEYTTTRIQRRQSVRQVMMKEGITYSPNALASANHCVGGRICK